MKKTILTLLLLLVSASFLFPAPVLAAYASSDEYAPLGKIKLPSWLTWTKAHPGISGINLLINNLVKMIFIIASVGLFIMFLWGGLQYIFSQGDKVRTETARNIITYAIIGFAIVALSFALMRLIETFFGISIIGGSSTPSMPNCIEWDQSITECENRGWYAKQEGSILYCCPPAGPGCSLESCIEFGPPINPQYCSRIFGADCRLKLSGENVLYCCPESDSP